MNEHQRERYSRQTIFAPLGEAGQAGLLSARVVIIGCGANGSVMASTLARAGVGALVLADRDFVELKNLQRQILFDEDDVARGTPKAIAAAEKLRRANSSIQIEGRVTDVNAENIEDLIAGATLVLDGTDNFETRFLINDACVKHSIPWIYAGAVASYGMTMTIVPRETACLRCVFTRAPAPGALPTCDTAGILPPIVNVIASIASAEAIKFIASAGTRNAGIINVDLWDNSFESFALARRADCPVCAQNQFEYLDGARGGTMTAFLCGRNAIQVNPGRGHALDLASLADRLRGVGKISLNEYLLKLSIDNYQLTIFPDARAIIQGTDDATVARSLYAKYVGT
ncbi:MAG: thiazole biosynthesis adenylyltransferase ThiF [Chloroflexi bacterium]|nr:thiazole biosynthesis adenylyltransferase ThiF [Chloroflexota bacterium]